MNLRLRKLATPSTSPPYLSSACSAYTNVLETSLSLISKCNKIYFLMHIL